MAKGEGLNMTITSQHVDAVFRGGFFLLTTEIIGVNGSRTSDRTRQTAAGLHGHKLETRLNV